MIEARNITKTYNGKKAVDNISFEVRKGEILGFLGPNGAGKTTTMKILTCFMPATSGTAIIDGLDVNEYSLEVRKKIGYLPETSPLYPEMGVLEYLSFVAEVRNISKKLRTDKIKNIVNLCGLKGVMGKDVGELSRGYRQRLGLAQAMIHNPDILILDEPTSGLDPNQIVEIRNLIKELGKEKTVILSTHILTEVQVTCHRVLIINEGKIVANGTPQELQTMAFGHGKIYAKFKGPKGQIQDNLRGLRGVMDLRWIDSETDEISGFQIETEKGIDLRESLFHMAVDNGWALLELKRESVSLEDVFRKLTAT